MKKILMSALLLLGICSGSPGFALTVFNINTNKDVFHDPNVCSLRDALENIRLRNQSGSMKCPAGSTNNLIKFNSAYKISLNSEIYVNNIFDNQVVTIKIQGPEPIKAFRKAPTPTPVILDGQNKTRIFYVNTRVDLTLENMFFTLGKTAGSGGAIIFEGGNTEDSQVSTLHIFDSTFFSNYAETNGAALHADAGKIELNNVVFEANYAKTAYGGAVSLGGVTVPPFKDEFHNVSFIDNSASAGGGAMFCSNSSRKLDINFANFRRNKATNGGAIRNQCHLSIHKAHFEENKAFNSGGAIYQGANSPDLLLEDVFFEQNTASSDGVSGSGNGGAIYSDGLFDINRASFSENKSFGGPGGAITLADAINGNPVSIVNTTFDRNTAKGTQEVYPGNFGEDGAAIWVGKLVTSVQILNSTISDNVGLNALYLEPGNNSKTVKFDNNIIQSDGLLLTVPCGGQISRLNASFDNIQYPGQSCNMGSSYFPEDNPMLDDAKKGGWNGMVYRLPKPNSPAIGKGNSMTCTSGPISNKDQFSNLRISSLNMPSCNIGAVEKAGGPAVYPVYP